MLLPSVSSFSTQSCTFTVSYVSTSRRITTFSMPALMMRRLHIVQEFASDMIFPVDISRPTRYSVAPIIWSRGAAIMAFISACTERQNSYLSPRGMPIF